MNKEEDSSIYFLKNKFYNRIKRMNNDINFNNKIEDSKSTQDDITNDFKNDKTYYNKSCFINNKKKLYNKNNFETKSISHFEISNLFKAIDNSYINLGKINKKNQIFCRSKSQNYFSDSLTRDKNDKGRKKKRDKTQKYEHWENPFFMNLNEQLYNFSHKFFYKYKQVKEKKNEMSLKNYQDQLIKISSLNFPKLTINKLSYNFKNLRNKYYVKIEESKNFIKNIEEKEKNIYKNILQNQDKYIKLLGKYKSFKCDLPKIEMKTILKN